MAAAMLLVVDLDRSVLGEGVTGLGCRVDPYGLLVIGNPDIRIVCIGANESTGTRCSLKCASLSLIRSV